jgi:hypothetical protein
MIFITIKTTYRIKQLQGGACVFLYNPARVEFSHRTIAGI